jgi:predicted O-methyltransferase YrrM
VAIDPNDVSPPPDERGWLFVESLARESETMRQSRSRSAELNAPSISPSVGSALSMLIEISKAKHVVEIETNTGGATQWIARGLTLDGQVTTIDFDGEHHRIAKELFQLANIPTSMIRMITGRPREVLPRLSDEGYDAMVLSVESDALDEMYEHAFRLLRIGGLVIVLNALGNGKVGDPAQRDPSTVARRLFIQRLNNDPRIELSLLTVGDGIAVGRIHSTEIN